MARAPLRASASNGNKCDAGKAEPSGTTAASRVDSSSPKASALTLTAVTPACGTAAFGSARAGRLCART